MSTENKSGLEQKSSRLAEIINPQRLPEAGFQSYEELKNNATGQKEAFLAGEIVNPHLEHSRFRDLSAMDKGILALAGAADKVERTEFDPERTDVIRYSLEFRMAEMEYIKKLAQLEFLCNEGGDPLEIAELAEETRDLNESLYGKPDPEIVNAALSTQVNLMPNATFDSGLNNGWKTDDTTNIKLDSANHGAPANPVNSVAAIKTNGTAHLFAPQIAVSGTKSYYLENYLNITANNGGEVGFYIDEYDTTGNWISGQYKATVNATGAKEVVFNYTPSSSAVAKAGLQVIFTGGKGLSAYFDNSRFWAL